VEALPEHLLRKRIKKRPGLYRTDARPSFKNLDLSYKNDEFGQGGRGSLWLVAPTPLVRPLRISTIVNRGRALRHRKRGGSTSAYRYQAYSELGRGHIARSRTIESDRSGEHVGSLPERAALSNL
jgi:hypothetical protein